MTAALLAPKGAAVHFGIRRKSGGVWQFSLWQGEKAIIPFVGQYRGPQGRENCLAAIALVRSVNEQTQVVQMLAT